MNFKAEKTQSSSASLYDPASQENVWSERVSTPPAQASSPSNLEDLRSAIQNSVSRGDDVFLDKTLQSVATQHPDKLPELVHGRYHGETLMMLAARDGHWQVGSTLLKYGVNPSVGRLWRRDETEFANAAIRIRDDKSLTTPLFLAARAGHHQFVELLLGAGIPNDDVLASFLVDVDLKVAITTKRVSSVSPEAVRGIVEAWVSAPDGHTCAERLLFAMREYRHVLLRPKAMVLAAKNLRAPAIKLLYRYGLRADRACIKENECDLAQGHVNTSSHWLFPMDVAAGRATNLDNRDEIDALRSTITELVLARGQLKADHLTQLINLNDLKTLSMGIKLVERVQPSAVAAAVAGGYLAQVALLIQRRKPSAQELQDLMDQAQDSAFPKIFNLLSAFKACQIAEEKQTSSTSRVFPDLSYLWSSNARVEDSSDYEKIEKEVTPNFHQDTEIGLAKERYTLLHSQAILSIDKESQDIALPPPRAANTERQLTLFRPTS